MLRLSSALFVFAGLSATSRALPPGELAKGGTVPAGTAMVRRTVTLSPGRRAARRAGSRCTSRSSAPSSSSAPAAPRSAPCASASPSARPEAAPAAGAKSRPTPARPLGALPRVSADAAMIGAVFTNLLMNGLKYGPREGGTIRVGASREPAGWRFVVESEGQTIALEDRNRIFEPYRRGRGERRAGGSGLGLAISATSSSATAAASASTLRRAATASTSPCRTVRRARRPAGPASRAG